MGYPDLKRIGLYQPLNNTRPSRIDHLMALDAFYVERDLVHVCRSIRSLVESERHDDVPPMLLPPCGCNLDDRSSHFHDLQQVLWGVDKLVVFFRFDIDSNF